MAVLLEGKNERNDLETEVDANGRAVKFETGQENGD
jgi:hypothetical protein